MLSDPLVVDIGNPWGKQSDMMADPDWEEEVEGEITLLDRAADLCQLPGMEEDQFKHPAATLLPPEIGFREIRATSLAVTSLTPIYVPRQWGTPLTPNVDQVEELNIVKVSPVFSQKSELTPDSVISQIVSAIQSSPSEEVEKEDVDEGKADEIEEEQVKFQPPPMRPVYLPFPCAPTVGQLHQVNTVSGVGMAMLPAFPNMNPAPLGNIGLNVALGGGGINIGNNNNHNNGLNLASAAFNLQPQQPIRPRPQVGASPKNGLYIPLADCRQMITVGGNLLPNLPNPGFPQPPLKPR